MHDPELDKSPRPDALDWMLAWAYLACVLLIVLSLFARLA